MFAPEEQERKYFIQPLVVIASPFSDKCEEVRRLHVEYAKDCCRDSFKRGEIPFASHLLYPSFLDDESSHERNQGISASLALIERCEYLVVCIDRGISPGMIQEIYHAISHKKPITFRSLNRELDSRVRDKSFGKSHPQDLLVRGSPRA